MVILLGLLLFFLLIGLCARQVTWVTRLLLIVVIGSMVIYAYLF
ncbi:MAG TPA: hypothetical protein VFY89_01550 [Ktedonobacterales bacterium]